MYYFIINPQSRSGAALAIWRRLGKTLTDNHIRYHRFFTRYRGHAAVLAARLSDHTGSRHVIAVLGGDGTLNEVINGLKDPARRTLAYIPTGSGNDFARGMGMKTDFSRGIPPLFRSGTIRRLDICQCQTDRISKRFVISSGLGFDAAICHEALHSPLKKALNKIRAGKLTYTFLALRQLISFHPFCLQLITDNGRKRTFENVYFIAAMNLKYEGGGFQFCPQASADDGYLDLFLIHGMSKLKILLLLPTAFFGLHTRFKGVEIIRCQKAEFLADRPLPVHIDGESAGVSARVRVSVLREQPRILSG